MSSVMQASVIAALAIGTGTAAVGVMNKDIPDLVVPSGDWQPGAALDGVTFYTTDKIVETGEIVQDILKFRDGTFQSVKCQVYCDFGWSDYETWDDGETLHFTATTLCPDAPHTVVWYGTVTGDAVEFAGTWTTRRWYWTRQINVTGAGTTTPPPETADAPTG